MDNHIKDFYSQFCDDTPKGNFHKVISLNKEPKLDWGKAVKLVPNLPKGWFELAHLSVQDRIDFTRDFWLTKLPYHPNLDDFLNRFFGSLDDIIIFLTQQKFDDPFEAHMVYSLKGDKGFFRGASPATEQEIVKLQNEFLGIMLPEDYLAFLQINNGFCKTTDCTGITSSKLMKENSDRFQKMLIEENTVITNKGKPVDPTQLIPFYESFGMPFYQCFWVDWYPGQEMGNVYYSGITKSISEVNGNTSSGESMSFPTFNDWLMFYMELVI